MNVTHYKYEQLSPAEELGIIMSCKQLANFQLVGTGDGYSVKRNLYEDRKGNRISIQKTKPIFHQQKVIN